MYMGHDETKSVGYEGSCFSSGFLYMVTFAPDTSSLVVC